MECQNRKGTILLIALLLLAGPTAAAERAIAAGLAESPKSANDTGSASPADSVPPSPEPFPGRTTGWHTPEEIQLAPPPAAPAAFEFLSRLFSIEGLLGTAERKAQRWLGFEKVELRGEEVRVQREYHGRLLTLTYAGLGPSSESGVQGEYPLWGSWALRSETRERGDSFLEIRREINFW